MTPRAPLCLVADIGGTNTRVALAENGVLRPDTIRRYANREHPALEAVLSAFVAEAGGVDCAGACVAVAGPVRDGVAAMTNLDWAMTEASIGAATGAGTVALLNDLQAQGHALGHLEPGSLRTIVAGPPSAPGASQLVVNAGTGFNAAPVHDTERGRLVAPSECGHVSLPVRSAADLALSLHLEEVHGFASVEDALSGRGLERLDAWLAAGTAPHRSAADIMAAVAAAEPQATRAARLFVELLGSVTGNLALTHLPFGGIYLVGGVVRHMTPYLQPLGFAAAFRDKGRFSEFMDGFPVHVIEDDYAALRGCAVYLNGRMQG